MSCRIWLAITLSATAAVPSSNGLRAQRIPETVLRPEARLSEPFTRVRGIRELPDGRVLVADQTERAVYLADFTRQTRAMIGTNGAGPEEYDMPTGLLRLRGDSAAVVDIRNGRLVILSGDARIVDTRPLLSGENAGIPTRSDTLGNFYWDLVSRTRVEKSRNPAADRASVMRQQPGGRADSAAFLMVPGGVNPGPFAPWDMWAVSADGRIAIARNGPEYRVDWVSPRGEWTRGTPVAESPLRVTAADREEHQVNPGRGAGASVSMTRSGEQSQPRAPRRDDLPEHFPFVRYHGVWVSEDGRAWVDRYQHLKEKRPLLDVFDASGRLTLRHRLPEARQVVGFGPRGLYAVHIDDDGLQWLERYHIDSTER